MEAALELLGYNADRFDVVLIQMVSLVEGGNKVSMSTRSGQFITLDWLLDEVGVDAARFFYNMRSADAQFEFDIDLAKSRSSDNPVFYVQYAHARVASLLANAKERGIEGEETHLDKLTLPQEITLIKKLMELPSVISTAAQYNEPHRISYYLTDLAGDFHAYYYNTVILNADDMEHSLARLSLCKGVATAVKFGLGLIGVSAPDKM
jgi:arginyl-tRNA synthetase